MDDGYNLRVRLVRKKEQGWIGCGQKERKSRKLPLFVSKEG